MSWFPERLPDGLLLAGKAKGICKSADLLYALSIRINLRSTYTDGAPVQMPGSGRLLRYHREGADPADRDRRFANRGPMQCFADWVPVGVLREQGRCCFHLLRASPSFPSGESVYVDRDPVN